MSSPVSSHSLGLPYWRSWCTSLWNRAENPWLNRSGQDHYNRDQVVLPALEAILASNPRFSGLVDIGCGDGYTTAALVEALDRIGKKPDQILLLDVSERQLLTAIRRPALKDASMATIDLETSEWSSATPLPASPIVFISVFVIQELPSLDPFLNTLSHLLRPDDLCLCVTLLPSFSQKLADRGAIKLEGKGDTSVTDWEWAGGFPVPVGGETVYLPHFQRGLEAIIRLHAAHGLDIFGLQELTIAGNDQARNIFEHTAYGPDIIGQPSSVLLSIKQAAQGGN
jgi:SAM-dependent methyltransferase